MISNALGTIAIASWIPLFISTRNGFAQSWRGMPIRARMNSPPTRSTTRRRSFWCKSSIQTGSSGSLERRQRGSTRHVELRRSPEGFNQLSCACFVAIGRFAVDVYISGGRLEPKTGTQILIAWAPFLVLIACWIIFMLYFRMSPAMVNRRSWVGQTLHHLQRIEELLENIARKIDRDDRK
jgi:hypothetical protein